MSGEQRAVVRRRVEFGAAELIPDLSRSNGWLLTVDGVLQSYVDLADPAYLYMPYAQWVRQAVDRHWPAAESITAVVIGGGGFTVPRYLATSRPGSTLTVYELDGPLVELVREHLELDAIDGLRVRVRDGAKGLASTDDGGVDLVVQDAYRAGDPVPDMATVEFLRGQVARVLRPDGLYLANMWGSGDLEFVLRAIAAVGEVFEHLLVFAEAGAFMRKRPGNFVVAASNARLAERELAEWASNTDNHVHCLNRAQLSAVYGAEIWSNPLIESAPITAPVEPVLRWGHRALTS